MNNRGRGGRGSHVPQLHTHRLGPRIPAGQNGGGTCGRGRGAPNAAAAAAGRICTATYSRQACAYDFMSANNVDDTGREITVNLKMIPSCSQSILIKPVSHPILQSVWVSGQTLCRLTATNGRNIRMEAIPLTPQEECLYIVGSSGIIKLVLI
mmetsp:Transcript_29095/g.44964  ORF Transcript_29095/g.44964 Transcript_29095/m.44964 type:complete len:153 (-) Transcript_29095:71-529(-)